MARFFPGALPPAILFSPFRARAVRFPVGSDGPLVVRGLFRQTSPLHLLLCDPFRVEGMGGLPFSGGVAPGYPLQPFQGEGGAFSGG